MRGDPEGGRDRAQVLLVTAFALAVAFVALSVVINGAIFTQNLATRGDTAGGDDALQYRQQTEQMVGDLLEEVNDDYAGAGSGTTRTSELRTALSDLGNASSYQQSVTGRAVDYSYSGATNGTRVSQNAAGNFRSSGGMENWTVVQGVPDTRAFDIYVDDTDDLEDPDDNPFTVHLEDTSSSDSWRMVIAEDSDINLTVTYVDGSDSFSQTCTAPDPSSDDLTVNVTAGLLAGQPCDALDFARNVSGTDGLGTYDIRFNNTDNVYGEYELTVNATSGVGSVPNAEEVLYSTTVDYTYRTANLVYETDVRVAPGEPDD
jgi:hypothetical protein